MARAGKRLDVSPIRVLSISTEYPNPTNPGLGVFVRARLQHVAVRLDVKVLAPVPLLDYSNPSRKWTPGGRSSTRFDGVVEVLHPLWTYPPFGTPLNVVCLFLALVGPARRLHRRDAFDVVDAHFGYPEGVAAALIAATLGVPFVVTLRGNEPFFARSRARRTCLRWALLRAARVVAVAEWLRQFAVDLGVAADRTRIIGNGVNSTVFHQMDRTHCRRVHELPSAARVILSAGSLLEAKGHHRVIRALAHLVGQGLDVHLVIAGSESRGGPGFEAALRRLVADLGLQSRVTFTGWRPPEALAQLMNAADVFCLASDSEGWPNVVHEASSCGTPVVTTDVGSVRDMVPSDRYGLIVPVGVQDRLNEALASALTRSWDRDAIAAWGQSRSWEQVADEVVEVLQAASVEGGGSRAGS